MTDEELDMMFPPEGYKILKPPGKGPTCQMHADLCTHTPPHSPTHHLTIIHQCATHTGANSPMPLPHRRLRPYPNTRTQAHGDTDPKRRRHPLYSLPSEQPNNALSSDVPSDARRIAVCQAGGLPIFRAAT